MKKKLYAVITNYNNGKYYTYRLPIDPLHPFLNHSSPDIQELEEKMWTKGSKGIGYFNEHTVSIEFEER
jgi:hypothetical protein